VKRHEIALSLQALEKITFTTEATENSVMYVNDEEATDRQQLQDR
jgi:hypothetical protein